ncbi:MAG TPA: DUF3822 family protein [Bacteroidia bacterium]|nr:DUF3822 family protein [Bacteroidia bacterium]
MANIKLVSLKEPDKYALDKASLANKSLHLSVEVRELNLLACLLDKESNQYLAWSSFNRRDGKDAKSLMETILKEEIFNYKCSSSSVVFTHNSAMLIPSAFFSSDSLVSYLKQQNLIKPGETACSDFIKNNDCYSVYSVATEDYDILKEKYPQAAFRHHSSVFVEYLLALHKGSDRKNEVHVFVFTGYMDVVAMQAGKLQLYNRYYFQTPNDFTYFLLWVYEELKLKPEDSPCFFYGEINEKSEMFDLSWRYLKNVRIAERISRFTFSPMLDSLPTNRYYSLFMQYLCI